MRDFQGNRATNGGDRFGQAGGNGGIMSRELQTRRKHGSWWWRSSYMVRRAAMTWRGELREPLQDADDAHVGGLAVRGCVLARLDFAAILLVVEISAVQHLFVGQRGAPVELRFDFRGVEEEILRDHLIVVRAERGNPQM